jgi:ATP-dependent protease Clp ATPase subunit
MAEMRCSFCNRSQAAVDKMIASPLREAYICVDCVKICNAIANGEVDVGETYVDVAAAHAEPPSRLPMWLIRTFKLRPPT